MHADPGVRALVPVQYQASGMCCPTAWKRAIECGFIVDRRLPEIREFVGEEWKSMLVRSSNLDTMAAGVQAQLEQDPFSCCSRMVV